MKKSIIGIDIGGSKIRAVLWNGKRVFKVREIKTPRNLTAFKTALEKLVFPLHLTKGEGLGEGVTKIGIAVPGRVKGTTFVSATNLSYVRNFDFVGFFPGAKVKIDHDARCFARAELQDVRRPIGRRAFLFLTLGTGVGRALGSDGKILKIKNFEYPVRWEREYKKIREGRNNAALAKFLAMKLSGILKAYGLPAGLSADKAGKAGVRQVIIGGGVAERQNFTAKLQKAIKIPVQKSKFGKDAVAIGAAMLFTKFLN